MTITDPASPAADGAGTAPVAAAPDPTATPAGAAAVSRRRSERQRPLLATIVVIAVLAAVLAAVARGYFRDGPLEPDAPTEQGSKAIVEVLRVYGADVQVDRHTEDASQALHSGRTVLVTAPSHLSGQQLELLDEALTAGDGQLVLVQPDFVTLSYFTSAITPSGSVRSQTLLEADDTCGPTAYSARHLHVPGTDGLRGASTVYDTQGSATGCFRTDDGDALVAADGRLLVLGSADLLTNQGIAAADNSALALNSLGATGEVTWYLPSATDPMSNYGQSLLSYLPDWSGPLALWLLLLSTVTLVAVGRRFGPVVVEPLPVTVRPQELVLGRARLLQRSTQRDAAATALRSACASRLAEQLGLRRESRLDALIAALAPHVSSSPEQLRELLGPTPVTRDQDLVQLAQDLDRLEKEIDR